MNTSACDNGKTLTLVDVAQLLGVSKSTVSAAFTGKGTIAVKRREEVRRVALELGYRPNPNAQRLVNREQDNTIALLTSYLDLDVRTQKLHLLQRLLSEQGHDTSIHALGDGLSSESADPTSTLQNLRRLRPRAIVCNQWQLNEAARHELKRFCEEGGVMVYYDVPLDLDCDQVIFNREENTYQAMCHLLELGHREIGFFIPPGDKWRIHGVRRALEEFGAPMRDEWVNAPRKGRYEDAGGHLAEYFFDQARRPTAMCIVNDNVTIGFVAQLQRRGLRIPDDVSVVSHHDTTAAVWGASVQLSSVSQPIETIVNEVASLLLDRLHGRYHGPSRTVIINGELKARESTAPLQKKLSQKRSYYEASCFHTDRTACRHFDHFSPRCDLVSCLC